jgi:hypothetical protein
VKEPNSLACHEEIKSKLLLSNIQGVFEIEAFLLTCDSMSCSKEF